jgi:hypothetical protein
MLSVIHAECRIYALYAGCHYTKCHYDGVVMLSVIHAECHIYALYAECHYASVVVLSVVAPLNRL